MSKLRTELAANITSSLHEELYKAYFEKRRARPNDAQEFGEYVGEQFKHILNALSTEE
ncbi:hypothetical protein [Streptococcus hyointestinalis]|nr:hypothetical protein [Streptococcus hyointestinalis]